MADKERTEIRSMWKSGEPAPLPPVPIYVPHQGAGMMMPVAYTSGGITGYNRKHSRRSVGIASAAVIGLAGIGIGTYYADSHDISNQAIASSISSLSKGPTEVDCGGNSCINTRAVFKHNGATITNLVGYTLVKNAIRVSKPKPSFIAINAQASFNKSKFGELFDMTPAEALTAITHSTIGQYISYVATNASLATCKADLADIVDEAKANALTEYPRFPNVARELEHARNLYTEKNTAKVITDGQHGHFPAQPTAYVYVMEGGVPKPLICKADTK